MVQLVIQMNEQGQIAVNGPIDNKVLCYGLLSAAHDAIKDYGDAKAKETAISIVPADSLPSRRVAFDANVRRNGT